jgi:GR25 family glycosyltransferase involved in LPS biosynthesis
MKLDVLNEPIVINLERDLKRRNLVLDELESHGFTNVNTFNAIDAKKTDSEYIFAELGLYERFGNKMELPLNFKGAFASHYKVWKQVRDGNEDRKFIFEDDVIFSSEFNELFSNYVDDLPDEDWDIIFVGYGIEKCYEKFMNSKYIHMPVFGSHAYILSKNGAKKIIHHWTNRDVIRQGLSDWRKHRVIHCDTFVKFLIQSNLLKTVCFNYKQTEYKVIHGDQKENNSIFDHAQWGLVYQRGDL